MTTTPLDTPSSGGSATAGAANAALITRPPLPQPLPEDEWFMLYDISVGEQVAVDIMDRIIDRAGEAMYEKALESQILPFTVQWAKKTFEDAVDLYFFHHDTCEVDDAAWTPDPEPPRCRIDSHAPGALQIRHGPIQGPVVGLPARFSHFVTPPVMPQHFVDKMHQRERDGRSYVPMASFDAMMKMAGHKVPDTRPKKKKEKDSAAGSVTDVGGTAGKRGAASPGRQPLKSSAARGGMGGMAAVSPPRKSITRTTRSPTPPPPPPPPSAADLIRAENARILARMAYQESLSPSRSPDRGKKSSNQQPASTDQATTRTRGGGPDPTARADLVHRKHNAAHMAAHKRADSYRSPSRGEKDPVERADAETKQVQAGMKDDEPELVLPKYAKWTYDHEGRVIPLNRDVGMSGRGGMIPYPQVRILDPEPSVGDDGASSKRAATPFSSKRGGQGATSPSRASKTKSDADSRSTAQASSLLLSGAGATGSRQALHDRGSAGTQTKTSTSPGTGAAVSTTRTSPKRQTESAERKTPRTSPKARMKSTEGKQGSAPSASPAPKADEPLLTKPTVSFVQRGGEHVVVFSGGPGNTTTTLPLRPPTSPSAPSILQTILSNPSAIVSLDSSNHGRRSPTNIVSMIPLTSTGRTSPGSLPPIPTPPSARDTPVQSRSETPGGLDGVKLPDVPGGRSVVAAGGGSA